MAPSADRYLPNGVVVGRDVHRELGVDPLVVGDDRHPVRPLRIGLRNGQSDGYDYYKGRGISVVQRVWGSGWFGGRRWEMCALSVGRIMAVLTP